MRGHEDTLGLLQLEHGLLLEGVQLEGPLVGHLRHLRVEVRDGPLAVQHLRPLGAPHARPSSLRDRQDGGGLGQGQAVLSSSVMPVLRPLLALSLEGLGLLEESEDVVAGTEDGGQVEDGRQLLLGDLAALLGEVDAVVEAGRAGEEGGGREVELLVLGRGRGKGGQLEASRPEGQVGGATPGALQTEHTLTDLAKFRNCIWAC